MRHPRRFCVACNKNQLLVIREKEKFSMYHCKVCGEEICRLGDGLPDHTDKIIKNYNSSVEYMRLEDPTHNILLAALGTPDILSDEQSMWPQRDLEAEERRAEMLEQFKEQLSKLTEKEIETIQAIANCGSQEAAAIALDVSVRTVKRIMRNVRDKIKWPDLDKREHNMEGMYE